VVTEQFFAAGFKFPPLKSADRKKGQLPLNGEAGF
jgi:hypothetical protein